MALTWLHLSDFHIRAGDAYDREVVLRALVESVRRFRDEGLQPDLVFATGDIGFSGKAGEYEIATAFFDEVLDAAGLQRRDLLAIPGNHDADRDLGVGLARSLPSQREADRYFSPNSPRPHLTQKQRAFQAWYQDYFAGIRDCPSSSCGPVELVEAGGLRVGILPINSALFCQDDHDHAKLWVGRRALDDAIAKLRDEPADLRIALIHHPLDWLADAERANVRAKLSENVDVILRGHLHETEVEHIVSSRGGVLHLAAGATYQADFAKRALYVTVENAALSVFPIRYEDSPAETWTLDPSLFPNEPDHTGLVRLPETARDGDEERDAASAPPPAVPPSTAFRSTISSRRGLPFVGRDEELDELARLLGDSTQEGVVILSGPPGVGKSELAREFARRHRDRYPGGTFSIDATSATPLVGLSRVAVHFCGLTFDDHQSLEDQCDQSLVALSAAPVLLLYDNVRSFAAIERWLPATGVPCHVVITSTLDPRTLGWSVLQVDPLPPRRSVELVEALAGRRVAEQYGTQLAEYSGGLPVELCPAAAMLAYEERRGRRGPPKLAMAAETRASFALVYERLDERGRLLLHAATGHNPQRIDPAVLRSSLELAASWSELQFSETLDACIDLHLLQGDRQMTMHQLFASFLRSTAPSDELAEQLAQVRDVQRTQLLTAATELDERPADGALATRLMGFALSPEIWELDGAVVHVVGRALVTVGEFEQALPWFEQAAVETRKGHHDGPVHHDVLGTSLHEIGVCYLGLGEFEQARPWFERAVAETREGGLDGRIDHDSLGTSLHEVGVCHARLGEHAEARGWFEQAVEEISKGDLDGRIDHESLSTSLHELGLCYGQSGDNAQARPWFEQAVEETRKGDLDGRVDHDSLGKSLHEVGVCHARLQEDEQALPWLEQAVQEKRLGDVHGRVDPESIALSLHEIGLCRLNRGEEAQARSCFEQAVAEGRQGDVYRRVDHDSLGTSLHEIGLWHANRGDHAQARPWFEQTIAEVRQGNVHGRVDRENLRIVLLSGALCLRELGDEEQASAWEAEARELAAQDP